MSDTKGNENKLSMKALIYKGIRDIELQKKELPVCGPDDVIVRNVRAGICGTDVTGYLYGGEKVLIYPGREFGHEMVGYVYEKGKNVTGVDIGTRDLLSPRPAHRILMRRIWPAPFLSIYGSTMRKSAIICMFFPTVYLTTTRF